MADLAQATRLAPMALTARTAVEESTIPRRRRRRHLLRKSATAISRTRFARVAASTTVMVSATTAVQGLPSVLVQLAPTRALPTSTGTAWAMVTAALGVWGNWHHLFRQPCPQVRPLLRGHRLHPWDQVDLTFVLCGSRCVSAIFTFTACTLRPSATICVMAHPAAAILVCGEQTRGQRRLDEFEDAVQSSLQSNVSDVVELVVGDAFERFTAPSSHHTLYGGTFRLVARDLDGLPTVSDIFMSSRRIDSIGAVLERNLTREQACNHSEAAASLAGLRSTDPSVECGLECRENEPCIIKWPLELRHTGNSMIFFPPAGQDAASLGQPCNPQGFDDCRPMSELPYPLSTPVSPIVLPASEWHTKLETYRERLRRTNGEMEVLVKLKKAGRHSVRLRVCEERCSDVESPWSYDEALPWTVPIEGTCAPNLSPDEKDDCRCNAGFQMGSNEFECEQCPQNFVKTTQSRLPNEPCVTCQVLVEQVYGKGWDPNRVNTLTPPSDLTLDGRVRPGAKSINDCLCRYSTKSYSFALSPPAR